MKRQRLRCIGIVLFVLTAPGTTLAADPTSQPLPRLETGMHTAIVWRIATDTAGRWAVTASHDKTGRVWEVASGRQVTVLRPPQDAGNEGKLYAVALSPDGATVALGGWSGGDWDGKVSIYLFERASGRLLRRIPGLPEVILHLAFSPDARWLAASLGGENGVRLFDAASGAEAGGDAEYGDASYSAHFSPDGHRLVTTCLDGQLRLYAVEAGRLRRLTVTRPGGGERPFAARFSPDGRAVAVGYYDSTAVQVLDAHTLAEIARPATTGVTNGFLSAVAWSADGRHLLAGGYWTVAGKYPVRRWTVGDWARYRDQPLSQNTLMDLAPLPDGGMLFAAADPSWGVLDRDGKILRRQDAALADLRAQEKVFGLSADGRRVRFGYQYGGEDARVFDVAGRSLGADDPELAAARTSLPGLTTERWKQTTVPRLNGRALQLAPYEAARSLAIADDGRHFAVGTEWLLRLYTPEGTLMWQRPVPDVAWAVNLSADGRFVVAGYGDGTIRWHRFKDGEEVLALFPHADRKRWIAWTPEGYFDASPGAEDLIGYHLNRGRDRKGEFVSARQLWETFYQPNLIARRLDADGDALLAEMVEKRGDVRKLLAVAPPELELVSITEEPSDGSYRLRVRAKSLGQGKGRLVLRVDGQEQAGRWQAPPLTPGGVVEVSLDAAQGRRDLSVELVDGRGIASQPVGKAVSVRRPNVEAATLHVLAIGVSNYREGDLRRGVAFAAVDARDIAARLKERGALLPMFQERLNVRTLVDDQATVKRIEQTLKEMIAKARPEDVFVLFLAGHGTTLDGEYYFMPWELEYENDAALRRQAISQESLRAWQSRLPARSLLLLDTCRAGNLTQLAARDGDEKEALLKLTRVSQRNVIVASSVGRIALEGYKGHGVFSWAVLDALLHADYDNSGTVDVSDVAMHVRRLVPEITEREFRYRQVPMQDTPGQPFALTRPER